jgi:hypothetical protein
MVNFKVYRYFFLISIFFKYKTMPIENIILLYNHKEYAPHKITPVELIIQQKKLNTIYINDYLQRDNNYEIMNFIKYTWEDIQIYNLSNEILNIFKLKLTELYNLIKK